MGRNWPCSPIFSCPSDTRKRKEKSTGIEDVFTTQMRVTKPVTVVCVRYEREEEEPSSLIRTCQELLVVKSCFEDILKMFEIEDDDVSTSRGCWNELDDESSSSIDL